MGEGEPKSIAGRKWADNVLKLSLIGVVAAIIAGSKGNSIADRKPGDIRQGDKLGQRILTKPTLGDTAALIGVVALVILRRPRFRRSPIPRAQLRTPAFGLAARGNTRAAFWRVCVGLCLPVRAD